MKTPRQLNLGLTLIEVLAILTIVAVLATLLWPIAKSAKDRVQDAQCVTKLRQYGVALSQYRYDNGGYGVYGDPYAMALTGADKLLDGGYIEDPKLLRCPLNERGQYDYVGFLEQRGEEYRHALGVYFAYWKDDGIVRADTNHNPYPANDLGSPYLSRKGIGLFLGGHVRVVRKMGSPADWSFWHDQNEYWQFASQFSQGGQP